MCVVCGCGDGHVDIESPTTSEPGNSLDYGKSAAQFSVPGVSEKRAIALEANVLGENNRLAAINRTHFARHGVTAYDIVSSPGSGKTTLLCATIQALAKRMPALPVAVIEGDQQSSLDADRIRSTGVEAIQINTGKGCHLDAKMVATAFDRLHLHSENHDAQQQALLLIENVGNLVCPALWDLGEAAKVVVLSVTEGDDKPLKYPDMFSVADLLIINKMDLLPYVDFDIEKCIEYVRKIQPRIDVLVLSATRVEGIDPWIDWLLQKTSQAKGTELRPV